MPAILQKHPDVVLVLAGACTDEPYGIRIEDTIRRLGLNNKVILTGGLPPGDPRLIGLLQEARAVVLPSVSETFGLVILEAWAAGAMVLSSRTSGASALIQPGKNGWLFDLDQPETFLELLNRTLVDPAAASAMAQRGAEKVRSNYTLGAIASNVKQLYQELVEEKQCVT
jgi:glycosyltransferase involved in cell wall biosynthesis